jgi:hypothetical protein
MSNTSWTPRHYLPSKVFEVRFVSVPLVFAFLIGLTLQSTNSSFLFRSLYAMTDSLDDEEDDETSRTVCTSWPFQVRPPLCVDTTLLKPHIPLTDLFFSSPPILLHCMTTKCMRPLTTQFARPPEVLYRQVLKLQTMCNSN